MTKGDDRMKITFRKYTSDDFIKIRDLLIDTYKLYNKGYNWTIERWDFAYSLDRVMNGVSIQQWEERIGIWEDSGEIISVVTSEGEGHAFFQLARRDLPNDLIEEMFTFIENNLVIEEDGKRSVYLRIPEDDQQRQLIATKRGYIKTEWNEPISVIPIKGKSTVNLPDGFSIKNGLEFTDTEKGIAHAKAFGYIDKAKYTKRSPDGYGILRQTPDYRSDLDLYVTTETGEIVAFCTMWYDQANRIGMLEPVGTNPNFRRMGLARAVITEGLNRIADEGAIKAYVGSDQDFYKAIGFKVDYQHNIWAKIIG